MQSDIVLKMEKITKSFPGVLALDNVSIDIKKGEIHALVGENGAGKSTLMKVLSGAYMPDSGKIYIDGKPAPIKKPADAVDHGVSIVYQEQNVFAHTSVPENIFISQLPMKNGLIDYMTLKKKTISLMEKYSIKHIDPKKNCGQLSIGQQQMVEILKATSQAVKILVLDEPTSALTELETNMLFEMIQALKKDGVSIIYISHRLQEIFDICDRVTVMRDGKFIKTLNVANTDKDEIVNLMVGRSVVYNYGAGTSKHGNTVLEVKNLSYGNVVKDVSFMLKAGEVTGMAGLEGSGRTELVECIFGLRKKSAGEIMVNGVPCKINSPRAAKKLRMAYITKERKKAGLFMRLGVGNNIVGASLNMMATRRLLDREKINTYSQEYINKFDIKTPNIDKLVVGLSGGNQQKVLLAMWLIQNPQILLIDEPTRGIDVGTKEEIHKLIRNMAKDGAAVLMISSDMQEILGASDRVMAFHEGRVTGFMEGSEINEQNTIRKMSGMD